MYTGKGSGRELIRTCDKGCKAALLLLLLSATFVSVHADVKGEDAVRFYRLL